MKILNSGGSRRENKLPKITQPLPKNLMIRAGQKLKLECKFKSPCEAVIAWMKDDIKQIPVNSSSAEVYAFIFSVNLVLFIFCNVG